MGKLIGMTKSEKSYMLMGASIVLFLLSLAGIAEGTWVEPALKFVAIAFVAALLVATMRTKQRLRK